MTSPPEPVKNIFKKKIEPPAPKAVKTYVASAAVPSKTEPVKSKIIKAAEHEQQSKVEQAEAQAQQIMAQEEQAMKVEEAEKEALAQAEAIYNNEANKHGGVVDSAEVVSSINENQGLDANSDMGENFSLKDELKKSVAVQEQQVREFKKDQRDQAEAKDDQEKAALDTQYKNGQKAQAASEAKNAPKSDQKSKEAASELMQTVKKQAEPVKEMSAIDKKI